MAKDSTQTNDIKRFEWFSAGYIGLDKAGDNKIADVRYSRLPHQVNGMWGIKIDPDAEKTTYVQRYSARRGVDQKSLKENFDVLWAMILGRE